MDNNIEKKVEDFQNKFNLLSDEVSKVIVGNKEVINGTLSAFFAGGHILLEGVPGLGKTLLVKTVSNALGLSFKRIQFTPDLMPADVTGTEVLNEDESGRKAFSFKQGPIFANIVLADEINRATPKTQSSLLEAMEEKQVTVLGQTHKLDQPFFVLATQNPVELEGTYPLPEAQLDRFLLKLLLKLPKESELKSILDRTTGTENPEAKVVFNESEIENNISEMKKLVREVTFADTLKDVLLRVISALNPESQYATENVKKYLHYGSGPRGAQAIVLYAKVQALLDGRITLSFDDLKKAIIPCLRHRLILNFQAQADSITADDIIREVLEAK
ncbi:UNVERIFIED_CONTAM: hypothetical protein GTU68_007036 [Idotea baltica]|nr:hypothetical protein [Idotea baltica]